PQPPRRAHDLFADRCVEYVLWVGSAISDHGGCVGGERRAGMTSSETRISVIIPAYNYAQTLPRAVESVLVQLDDTVAELIVIDDGSTDDTPQVIEALLASWPGRFRALR